MNNNNLVCGFTRLFLFSLLVINLESCEPHGDFSVESKSLDSLSVSLDSAALHLRSFEGAAWSGVADTIDKHLDYIQKNYRGDMRKDIAAVLSDYRNNKKLATKMSTRLKDINTEIGVSKKQLSDLVQALKDGATHDAQGNKMNDEYVKNAINAEKETAGSLIKEVRLMSENAQNLNTSFNELYPQVKHWVDSIPAFTPKKTE
jgi:hypothetical protein